MFVDELQQIVAICQQVTSSMDKVLAIKALVTPQHLDLRGGFGFFQTQRGVGYKFYDILFSLHDLSIKNIEELNTKLWHFKKNMLQTFDDSKCDVARGYV